jgi:hypothetical protein
MLSRLRSIVLFGFVASLASALGAQPLPVKPPEAGTPGAGSGAAAFAQLEWLLPTPTETRLASGAPGPLYWQQRADYKIEVRLDDAKRRIEGKERISYQNRSPHTLTYLWLQLDQNRFRPDSDNVLTQSAPASFDELGYDDLAQRIEMSQFEGGFEIGGVTDAKGAPLKATQVKTMMRVDLPAPLPPGGVFIFHVTFAFNVIDGTKIRARTGYELFKDGNAIYEIAQFYPRMAAYLDYQGWQHKQFLGSGEFTLELGDYDLSIDVPEDHVVAATGVLQNQTEVLSAAERERLGRAGKSDLPVYVITPEEAASREKRTYIKEPGRRVWRFKADNVRDVAFASSRKFIWDAMGVQSGPNRVLAMSFFPNEGDPLWSQYSTEAVAHTIETYSKFTFDFPYPVAISVNGPVGGMEYPMICFNQPRPYEDKTYWGDPSDKGKTWKRSKYGLISVVIHEVGHNYFPMIVNSDERQWTWMDEGLNTFLQYLAEQSWEKDYPSRRGEPKDIVSYMVSADQTPIMTNSESVLQFGNNAYGKPATALNILRESILGRELFDFAFRQYAQRWKFKHPTPADFFRTMEDASGVDLDWFWRGWFYGTGHVDVGIERVSEYVLDAQEPDGAKKRQKEYDDAEPQTLSAERNAPLPKRIEARPELADFYNRLDEYRVTPEDYADYKKLLASLEPAELEVLASNKRFFAVDFVNRGGLVTPLPLRISYADGSHRDLVIPAEIWRYNAQRVTKLFIEEKEITGIEIDPKLETADSDVSNNGWPARPGKTRFQLYKPDEKPNPIRKDKEPKDPKDGKDGQKP